MARRISRRARRQTLAVLRPSSEVGAAGERRAVYEQVATGIRASVQPMDEKMRRTTFGDLPNAQNVAIVPSAADIRDRDVVHEMPADRYHYVRGAPDDAGRGHHYLLALQLWDHGRAPEMAPESS